MIHNMVLVIVLMVTQLHTTREANQAQIEVLALVTPDTHRINVLSTKITLV
jgi:hypothetical protein